MQIQQGKEAEYQEYVTSNSKDDYSLAVVKYGEAWANAMEQAIEGGKQIEDVAKSLSHDVDEGITGFMYGCAVKALAYFWIHGEELRRWHNLDCQIMNEGERANKEGGVLNPAILTIGK